MSSNKIVLPRAIPFKLKFVTDLRQFGDANCAAVNAVVNHPSITNKRLLVSKTRISKKM